jgi:predicted acylesterase/phospholipase RssA
MKNEEQKKRALILAGGGIKVAFQAGVLQVWLDEAGLDFALADGASGGTFNLAMWCQGMSGTQIANNWRQMQPIEGVDLNWQQYLKLFYARSLFTLDKYKENVFPAWGLDWDQIRATNREATFNVYNFSRHELEILTPAQMDADWLCACVSLPMWFPPVVRDGQTYIDPVYYTDANLEAAIKRGADELWIIWTVSEQGQWRDGFVANYFQIIETSANGNFKRDLRRIEENNAAIAQGQQGLYGRHIEVKLLKAEVPLHYLINFSHDRLIEAVNLGVKQGREWCQQNGIPLQVGENFETEVHTAQTKLQFTEEMKGFVSFGAQDYDAGFRQGRANGTSLMFRLTIKIDGVNRFIANPMHEAAAEGYVRCDALGGQLPVEKGIFNLFVHDDDPTRKQMLYRLFFRDAQGQPLTLSGFKDIQDDPGFDVWKDTTTLFTKILRGHVEADEEAKAEVIAAGIIHIHLLDFLQQLTTFRVEGPTFTDKAAAIARFGKLFLGSLWDVYARELLPYGPI